MSEINTMAGVGRYVHSARARRERPLITNPLTRIPGLHYQDDDHEAGSSFPRNLPMHSFAVGGFSFLIISLLLLESPFQEYEPADQK